LYLPNSARLQNFEGFLRTFDPSDASRLDFSMHAKWVSVHPAAVAFAACIADLVTRNGGIHVGQISPVRSLPYLVRMRLFDYLKLDHGSEFIEHEEAGRFIPLKRLANTRQLSDFIVDMIPLLHATPQEVEPIRYVISELGRNVLEHANSPGGAFVCAQYYRESRTLSIGIADCGVGVRTSLGHAYRTGSDWDAICLALRPGVTGTTPKLGGNEYNAGAGLFFTKSIACASRNYFVVYSGSAMYKLRPLSKAKTIMLYGDPRMDNHTRITDLPNWTGTVVGIDLAIKQEVPFARLMQLIRDTFSVDVRTQRKEQYKKPRFI
jgi:anti-sigma regulatory factor (Ser/Thr protein kinase)